MCGVSGSATGARWQAMLHAVHSFIDDLRKQLEQLTRQVQFLANFLNAYAADRRRRH